MQAALLENTPLPTVLCKQIGLFMSGDREHWKGVYDKMVQAMAIAFERHERETKRYRKSFYLYNVTVRLRFMDIRRPPPTPLFLRYSSAIVDRMTASRNLQSSLLRDKVLKQRRLFWRKEYRKEHPSVRKRRRVSVADCYKKKRQKKRVVSE